MLWLSCKHQMWAVALAAGLFLLAAISDWLDGYLARKLDASSRFGALMDPVVDKTMILGALVVFTHRGLLPLWIVLVNMFREFLVGAVRKGLTTPLDVIGANWMGKAKFCVQVVAVGLVYLYLVLESVGRRLPGGQPVLYWAAVVMTVVSLMFLLNFARWYARDLFSKAGKSPPVRP